MLCIFHKDFIDKRWPQPILYLKGYLQYKKVISNNVTSETQIKNVFYRKVMLPS